MVQRSLALRVWQTIQWDGDGGLVREKPSATISLTSTVSFVTVGKSATAESLPLHDHGSGKQGLTDKIDCPSLSLFGTPS